MVAEDQTIQGQLVCTVTTRLGPATIMAVTLPTTVTVSLPDWLSITEAVRLVRYSMGAKAGARKGSEHTLFSVPPRLLGSWHRLGFSHRESALVQLPPAQFWHVVPPGMLQ